MLGADEWAFSAAWGSWEYYIYSEGGLGAELAFQIIGDGFEGEEGSG